MPSYIRDPRQFDSLEHWANKAQTWLGPKDVVLDADEKELRCGADFAAARYPATILHYVSHDDLAEAEQSGEDVIWYKPAKPDYIPAVEGLLCECGKTMDSDFWCPECGFNPPWG